MDASQAAAAGHPFGRRTSPTRPTGLAPADWPEGQRWRRPEGDVVIIVARTVNTVRGERWLLLEHAEGGDVWWVTGASTDGWRPA